MNNIVCLEDRVRAGKTYCHEFVAQSGLPREDGYHEGKPLGNPKAFNWNWNSPELCIYTSITCWTHCHATIIPKNTIIHSVTWQ